MLESLEKHMFSRDARVCVLGLRRFGGPTRSPRSYAEAASMGRHDHPLAWST